MDGMDGCSPNYKISVWSSEEKRRVLYRPKKLHLFVSKNNVSKMCQTKMAKKHMETRDKKRTSKTKVHHITTTKKTTSSFKTPKLFPLLKRA